ncbi:hypothetical protein QYE76_054308 [Lolium multiflorum]|uniref:Uncharacterized protein n=1 Tax=Lolium multiflorum TaxID=4521 RepID=A0AAD8SYK5_LOLMU|nr:hypothetical protein QYE76_054308 [Lolium multiflorum]
MSQRKLSNLDHVIIKEVSARRQNEYITAIEAKEKEIVDYWKQILATFLGDNEPPKSPRRKRKDKGIVISSSADTLPPAGEKAGDNLLFDKLKGPSTTEVISSDEDTRPTAKRKIDFVDDGGTSSPIRLDIPLYVANDLSCAALDNVLSGDMAHDFEDFNTLNVDDYSALGLDDIDLSNSSSRTASTIPSVTDIPSHLSSSSHGTEGALISNEGTSTQISMSSMNVSSIAEAVMKTFDSVLDTVFEGLDNSTIVDPHRCEVLKAIHSLLPARDDITRVAATRTALEKLICISSGMQEAQTTVGSKSQKRDGALVVADQEQASLADILETTAAKLSSMEEQRVAKMTHLKALKVQMEEAENALHDIEEGNKELKSTQSSKQTEAKKLRDTLSEANARITQEIKALQQKISAMGDEVGPIIENVKKLRSS